MFATNTSWIACFSKKTDNELTTKGGGSVKILARYPTIDLPTGKNFDNGEIGTNCGEFLVFNRWWEESDMDAEDLAKAALVAIDDWLDEEIVGFEPEEG